MHHMHGGVDVFQRGFVLSVPCMFMLWDMLDLAMQDSSQLRRGQSTGKDSGFQKVDYQQILISIGVKSLTVLFLGSFKAQRFLVCKCLLCGLAIIMLWRM